MRASGSAPVDVATSTGIDDHLVTFYESDDFLVDSVVRFLAPAVEVGQPTIAIATGEHLASIGETLAVHGARGADGGSDGHFVALDAGHTLDRLVVDGEVDAAAFHDVVGGILDEASIDGGDVRIFGEMVSLLWERGDVAEAAALEDLWNDLARARPFVLLCAYAMDSFDREADTDAFLEVCDKHSSVIPSESYSRLSAPDEQLRQVALLQQAATAGENERLALRRKQTELEGALDELRELDRLRNEFVAMVVHDIRSPASIASGYLDLLRDNWAELEADEAEGFLATAAENVDRIQRLVDEVLTMSRIESGEFSVELRPVDLGRIIERTVRQVRGSTGRDIRFARPQGLRAALADEDRQVQILTNLLSNAVKFSPEHTSVVVAIESREHELVVSVRDEGEGISHEDQPGLFRPFSRLDTGRAAEVEGTGLGLYIAKALIEKQGGTVGVDSSPGEGSTFWYTVLPATSSR